MENGERKIFDFVQDQASHVRLVQSQVWSFCNKLMDEAIAHDKSKFSDKEMPAFVASRDSLNQSKDGFDPEYQKQLMGEAIQHHVKTNSHHPEYWKAVGQKMPLYEIIAMFFDWRSRSLVKSIPVSNFWEYNKKKLIDCEQEHAIPVVEVLMYDYEQVVVK